MVAFVEAVHEGGELGAGEVPGERLGDLVVALLEVVERASECGGVLEVVGIQQLALDDRVVDLDLVEPAAVDRGVDEDQVRPPALEALDALLAAVIGAVVDDPEHARGGGVGLFGHDLVHEAVERGDPALGFAAAHDPSAPHVPCIEVAQRAHPLVLVLDELTATRCRRRARVDPRPGLDRGLGIGADDAVAGLKQLALPATLIQIEDRAGPLQEVGVAREDPRALPPRLDRVLCQPPSDRRR
jgi:hypothetical protein